MCVHKLRKMRRRRNRAASGGMEKGAGWLDQRLLKAWSKGSGPNHTSLHFTKLQKMSGLDPPGLNPPQLQRLPGSQRNTARAEPPPANVADWLTGGNAREGSLPGSRRLALLVAGGPAITPPLLGGFPRNVRSIPSFEKRIGQRPLEICLCAFPFQVICWKTEYDNDGARPERKVSATRHGERGKRCVLSFVTSERGSCPGFWSADPALGHRHPWASPSSPPGEVAATV